MLLRILLALIRYEHPGLVIHSKALVREAPPTRGRAETHGSLGWFLPHFRKTDNTLEVTGSNPASQVSAVQCSCPLILSLGSPRDQWPQDGVVYLLNPITTDLLSLQMVR